MATYKNSAGKVVQIAEMNPYHLDAAIKEVEQRAAVQDLDDDVALLAALRAEQAKRGGPPNRGDIEEEKS